MTIMKSFSLVAAAGVVWVASSIVLSAPAQACYSPVQEYKLFQVLEGGRTDIQATQGDLIQVEMNYAVVPQYMGAEIVAEYDRSLLEQVAEIPMNEFYPDRRNVVGVGGRVFLFRAKGEGKTTLVVKLVKGGRVIKEIRQEVVTSLAFVAARCF